MFGNTKRRLAGTALAGMAVALGTGSALLGAAAPASASSPSYIYDVASCGAQQITATPEQFVRDGATWAPQLVGATDVTLDRAYITDTAGYQITSTVAPLMNTAGVVTFTTPDEASGFGVRLLAVVTSPSGTGFHALTVNVTVGADCEPTTKPTVEPTTEPTVEPTTEPTVQPTAEPTVSVLGESLTVPVAVDPSHEVSVLAEPPVAPRAAAAGAIGIDTGRAADGSKDSPAQIVMGIGALAAAAGTAALMATSRRRKHI